MKGFATGRDVWWALAILVITVTVTLLSLWFLPA